MKKLGFYFLCFSLCFSICSCSHILSTLSFGNSNKWLPPKFRPAKSVLLVEACGKPKGRFNKAMIKYLEKRYPYKYIVVPTEKLKDSMYNDYSIYPFALVWSRHTFYVSGDIKNGGRPEYGGKGYDLNFVDRETSRNFPKTGKGCSNPMWLFKPTINTIVKHCRKS